MMKTDNIDFFISLNTEDENYALKDAILSFYPLEDLSNETSLRATLVKILTHKNLNHPNADAPICSNKGTLPGSTMMMKVSVQLFPAC